MLLIGRHPLMSVASPNAGSPLSENQSSWDDYRNIQEEVRHIHKYFRCHPRQEPSPGGLQLASFPLTSEAYDCALPLFRVLEWIEAELAMQAGCSERSPAMSGQLIGPSSGVA